MRIEFLQSVLFRRKQERDALPMLRNPGSNPFNGGKVFRKKASSCEGFPQSQRGEHRKTQARIHALLQRSQTEAIHAWKFSKIARLLRLFVWLVWEAKPSGSAHGNQRIAQDCLANQNRQRERGLRHFPIQMLALEQENPCQPVRTRAPTELPLHASFGKHLDSS